MYFVCQFHRGWVCYYKLKTRDHFGVLGGSPTSFWDFLSAWLQNNSKHFPAWQPFFLLVFSAYVKGLRPQNNPYKEQGLYFRYLKIPSWRFVETISGWKSWWTLQLEQSLWQASKKKEDNDRSRVSGRNVTVLSCKGGFCWCLCFSHASSVLPVFPNVNSWDRRLHAKEIAQEPCQQGIASITDPVRCVGAKKTSKSNRILDTLIYIDSMKLVF